jgi:hypothetical protein
MTTLLVWVSYTTTGERSDLPRSMYMASDSRITWGSEARRWDAGRKIFAPVKEPHLFGYCGDVVFPSLVLGQLVSAIDQGILFHPDASAVEKNASVLASIKTSHSRRHNVAEQDFEIVHVYRPQDWPSTEFSCWIISYTAKNGQWHCREPLLPSTTGVIISLGSGANAARAYADRWAQSDVGGTSRAIFSAFCDAVMSADDRLTGGVPQILGLYTQGPPRPLGFSERGLLFLHGLQLELSATIANVEWRDRLFQRIDPMTSQPLDGARRFARPNLD